jgi:DNA-binding NtrC family response regulator
MTQRQQQKIVILETDQERRDALKSMVSEWGHKPFIFEKESRCLDNLEPLAPDLVISCSLSVDNASRFIHTLQLTRSGMPVVIISDDQAIQEFVETNGFGGVSVLNVALDPIQIQKAINQVLEENACGESQQYCPLIVGKSPEIVKIKKMIADLNSVNETVLIQGEPGVGKELMARFIHLRSKRQSDPFVKLNVPQLPADFFEKQLLLLEDKQAKENGIFTAANNGTLFLEEIGRMQMEPQAALLKMIDETGIFQTVNDNIGVRIIATSSHDLKELADDGQFHKGLYYRLNVIHLDIPPLRSRLEDIPALTDFFTDKFCIESGRSHFQLSDNIKELLAYYHWPGNIQELEDLVKRIVVHGAEDHIAKKLRAHKTYYSINDYSKDIHTLAGFSDIKKHLKNLDNISLKKIGSIFLARAEKKLVKKALESTNWNRKKAAKLLDISYKSLLNKIKEYKLT